MNALIEDLQWRGLLKQSTDLAELTHELDRGLSFYCGFDPTAESLHVGSLLQLVTARRLQLAGHRPVLLVGGATGLIGDPKPNAERKLADVEQVQDWVQAITEQVQPFLSFEGPNGATVVNNHDWIGPMSVLDFLRDVGKFFPVNRMLARSVVASRLNPEAEEENEAAEDPATRVEDGISFTEFSYILLQSLDFCELFQRHAVTLQFGGSDQWGNIASGVELTRKRTGRQVHGFTTPLLTKADGTKFGKTENGTVWLNPNLTTPFQFHQFWLATDDAMTSELLRFLSLLPREDIEALEESTRDQPHLKLAQRQLADELTELVHGSHAVAAVKAAADALFGKTDMASLNWHATNALSVELGVTEFGEDETHTVTDLAIQSGLLGSKGEVRRSVKEGSLKLNGVKVTDADQASFTTLPGNILVLQRGKRNARAVRFV